MRVTYTYLHVCIFPDESYLFISGPFLSKFMHLYAMEHLDRTTNVWPGEQKVFNRLNQLSGTNYVTASII